MEHGARSSVCKEQSGKSAALRVWKAAKSKELLSGGLRSVVCRRVVRPVCLPDRYSRVASISYDEDLMKHTFNYWRVQVALAAICFCFSDSALAQSKKPS